MNLQALAAMDDCEHATGLTLEQHIHHQTPREALAAYFCDRGFVGHGDLIGLADGALKAIKAAGYDIIQRVSQGNSHTFDNVQPVVLPDFKIHL